MLVSVFNQKGRSKMADQPRTDFEKLQAKKRQEAALRKQMQYINSLSPEDREKIYAKKHRTHEEIKPKTLKQKAANYWYHYKWVTIGVLIAAAIGSFFLHDMLTREKYDFEMMVATAEYFDMDAVQSAFDKTSQYAVDTDGNGEQSISVLYVQIDHENAESQDPNYYMAQYVKFSAALSQGEDAIFVLDQKTYDFLTEQDETLAFEDLTQYSDNAGIDGDRYYLKDDPALGSLCDQGDDLFIVLRRLEDMSKPESEKTQKRYEDQVTYLTNLLNQTPEE
jgi:hypothetical protein